MDKLPALLEKELKAHTKKTNDICMTFIDEVRASAVPPVIYHYTDHNGLRGILEAGRLWCSDLFKLNDPSELNHGIRHTIEALQKEADKGAPEVKFFSDKFAKAVTGRLEETAYYFVCCFSKADNDLSQWRAYADDGHGYAIGFRAAPLEKAFGEACKPGSICWTFPVKYDEKKLRDLHEQLVAATIPSISTPRGMNLDAPQISLFLQRLSVRLASDCVRLSLFFKHEAYSREEEYRFLQIFPADKPVTDRRIRARPHSLVGYTEFEWKNVGADVLAEIVVGPASNPNVGSKFAIECLREFLPDPKGVSVRPSGVPYRTFRI